jgi:hypothetical protein
MSDITAATLAELEELKKAETFTVSDGIHAKPIDAPAKELIPQNTPIIRALPRVGGTGDAVRWNAITALTGGNLIGSPWVEEGERATRLGVTTEAKVASFRTIGLDSDVTMEAMHAAEGYQDLRALKIRNTIKAMMIKEESAVIGGNSSVALGTPTAPTVTAATSGGTITNATYNVIVVALTYEGWRNSSVSGGVKQSTTETRPDGTTYTLNGGSSNKSTATSQATTGSTSTLSCSTTAVRGAVAYAWYVGTSGNETLQAITTVNSVKLTSLTTTNQNATAITADASRNANLAFDGLLYYVYDSSNNAYFNALATGTPGTGTTLTSQGNGRITELDTMLLSMWENNEITPDVIYVNAQEMRTLTNLMTTGTGSTSILQYNVAPGQQGQFSGGVGFNSYYNIYGTGGTNQYIPIRIHPQIPPGTILAWANDLPAQYLTTNVPRVAEIRTRRDYYQIDYPLVKRTREFGIYAEECLVVYTPFAMGVITNIAAS